MNPIWLWLLSGEMKPTFSFYQEELLIYVQVPSAAGSSHISNGLPLEISATHGGHNSGSGGGDAVCDPVAQQQALESGRILKLYIQAMFAFKLTQIKKHVQIMPADNVNSNK